MLAQIHARHHFKPKPENWFHHGSRNFTSQLKYRREEWKSEWILGISNEPCEEAVVFEYEEEPHTKKLK